MNRVASSCRRTFLTTPSATRLARNPAHAPSKAAPTRRRAAQATACTESPSMEFGPLPPRNAARSAPSLYCTIIQLQAKARHHEPPSFHRTPFPVPAPSKAQSAAHGHNATIPSHSPSALPFRAPRSTLALFAGPPPASAGEGSMHALARSWRIPVFRCSRFRHAQRKTAGRGSSSDKITDSVTDRKLGGSVSDFKHIPARLAIAYVP